MPNAESRETGEICERATEALPNQAKDGRAESGNAAKEGAEAA